MASSYCNIGFNWNSEFDENVTREKTANVISYSFVDIESSDFDKISFENRINAHDTIALRFQKCENDNSFVTRVSCNNPEFSQIDGISIDSESRTLEISNDLEGYIKTVKGRKLVNNSDLENADDSDHFVCTCSFETSYSSLSLKLLSLGKRDSICIRSIAINIRQHNLNHSASNASSTFDMSKLKKDIEDMGDSVSDKALEFLATMETFEKNKMGHLGNLFGQNAMMSMQSLAGQNGISSIMRSVLGDETMRNLEEDVSSKNCKRENEEQDDIYSMLQAVCGKVAATRIPPKPAEEEPSSDTITDNVASSVNPANVHVQGTNGNSVLLSVLNQKLEEAKQDMRKEIHAVKNEVMGHIDDVKKEMMEQLNNITLLLQGLQQNSRNSQCGEDE